MAGLVMLVNVCIFSNSLPSFFNDLGWNCKNIQITMLEHFSFFVFFQEKLQLNTIHFTMKKQAEWKEEFGFRVAFSLASAGVVRLT